MAGNDAFVWFVAMSVAVFALLAFGTFFAAHSYDPRRGTFHFHMPHLVPHRAARRQRH